MKDQHFMILIDEYDRFANKLMFEQMDTYVKIVAGKSNEPLSSPIRTFYETLKTCSQILANFRVLSVGITPLALADASGVNFMEDISLDMKFGDIVGFSQKDIDHGLAVAGVKPKYEPTVKHIMKMVLNGYHFIGSSGDGLYNPQISLKFLKQLQTEPKIIYDMLDDPTVHSGDWARKLSDPNLDTSQKVLDVVARCSESKSLIIKLSSFGHFYDVGSVQSTLTTSDLLSANSDQNLYSFLYYHGVTTIEKSALNGNIKMKIPNWLRYTEFLPRLKSLVQLDESLLTILDNNPSAENMNKFLWSFVEQIKTPLDNYYSETSLQILLEGCMRASLHSVKTLHIAAEFEYSNLINQSDLIFCFSDKLFLLELKRIRPNAIDYAGLDVSFLVTKNPSWDHDSLLRNREFLTKPGVQLENFNIHHDMKGYYKDCTSVTALLEVAKDQVKSYANKLKNEADSRFAGKNIHKYAVVQVGYKFVVRHIE